MWAARSLATAQPMAGVTIDLLAVGQDVLGEAVTDEAGMVHFAPGLLRGHGAASYGALTAHAAGGDFTLQDLTKPGFDFSDRGVTGRPSPAPLQAFLYTERGIYRPGQSVELMALLRDRLGDAADLPLTLVLRRPNGMEARRFSLPAQPAAGFHQTVKLAAGAARGTWSVEALADPAGAAIGRVSFEVQDYVPQQLKVKLAAASGPLNAGQTVPVDLQGDFLYGAPAAGLHGQADLRVTRDPRSHSGAARLAVRPGRRNGGRQDQDNRSAASGCGRPYACGGRAGYAARHGAIGAESRGDGGAVRSFRPRSD